MKVKNTQVEVTKNWSLMYSVFHPEFPVVDDRNEWYFQKQLLILNLANFDHLIFRLFIDTYSGDLLSNNLATLINMVITTFVHIISFPT